MYIIAIKNVLCRLFPERLNLGAPEVEFGPFGGIGFHHFP